MQYTSSEAAKLLRKLNEELNIMLAMEQQVCVFNAALGEDIESVRPNYNYKEIQQKLNDLERKILTVKHAINKFNATCEIPEFGLTIDQMLVYMPLLFSRKNKLSKMATRLPKQRDNIRAYSGNSAVIDYTYSNYDVNCVKEDYDAVSDELARAQTALDVINNTVKMTIVL